MSSRLGIAGIVLLAAFGLAACGGGGGGTATAPPDPGPTLEDRQATQRTAINNAITAARTAVTGLTDDASDAAIGSADSAVAAATAAVTGAADLPATEKAAFNTAIAAVEGQLATKKTSIMAARDKANDAMKAAMAKLGKAMHAALGPPAAENTTALDNIVTTEGSNFGLQADGTLRIDAADGAGALTGDGSNPGPVTLKAGASAGSLGGWNGTNYALTTGTGASKLTNEARVYTNQGAPTSKAFGDVHTVITETGANKGYVAVSNDSSLTRVMAPAFTHSGTQTHTKADRQDAVYLRGTYDGAPGEYRCTGADACTSTNDGKGSVSGLAGTWHFKPDSGAMVSQPDANYLYFGWWVRKDKDDMPTAASAFVGEMGDVDNVGETATETANGGSLTGSATYAGKAAGKFAISNPLDGTGSAGHFTADAELTAKFGAIETANTNGVTGTIDNFRLNDGSEDPGWSVKLNRSSAWAGDGVITGPTSDATVWSINGNKADASGAWSGQMYDEMAGNPPAGDGSNIPTTVTGRFYSEFSTIGRMAGAFGANKQ